MLTTIIAIIIALATGTVPAQPTQQDSATPTIEKKDKEKSKTSDPTMSTFGGTGNWNETQGG